MKDDIMSMKNELKELKQESFAYEMLKDQRKQNKRLFIIWVITFSAFIILLGYTIYLLNDISVVSDEYTQEISEIENIENSTILNGGGK